MDLKTIRNELHKLTALVDGWEAPGQIPALERDLALEKLRTLYDAVRFADARTAAESPAADEEVSDTAPAAIDLGEVLSLDSLPGAEEEAFAESPSDPAGEESEDGFAEPAEDAVPAEFSEPEPTAESEVAVPVEEPALETFSEPEYDGKALVEPQPEAGLDDAYAGPEAEREPIAEPAQAPDAGPAPISVPVAEPVAMPQPAAEPESAAEKSPEPTSQAAKKQYVAPTLFGLEEETVRHRHKQRVIMSLYDTQAPAEKPARPEPSRPEPARPVQPARPEPAAVNPAETMAPSQPAAETTERGVAEDRAAEYAPANPAPEPASAEQIVRPEPELPQAAATDVPELPVENPQEEPEDEGDVFEEISVGAAPVSGSDAEPAAVQARAAEPAPAGAVLGEVINHDVQTLADTIAPPRDVASQLRRSEPVTDLRKAIGINDKFLLIRDLFGGDGAAYDEAIEALNGCGDLDDCMIYIAENYAWNPNSDGAKMLMELLERKFA